MKPTENFPCQAVRPDLKLSCGAPVGDFRCEVRGPHEIHAVSDHTLDHEALGTELTCAEVEVREAETATTGISTGKTVVIALVGLVIAALLGTLTFYLTERRGPETIPGFSESGPITVVNTDLHAFRGEGLEGVNVEQKALGGDEPTSPPAIIFSNGKEGEAKKKLHLYLDLGDKESRDLILLNQSLFKALVESGRAELFIHPVPSGEAYSIYAAEALAEAAFLGPDQAWQALIDILLTADVALARELGPNRLASLIAEAANDAGISEIDRESIQNGTFVSWLLSIGSDPRLTLGTKVPSMFVGESPVELPSLNLTNNPAFDAALEER